MRNNCSIKKFGFENKLQHIAKASHDQIGTSTQLSLAKASYHNNKVPKQLSKKQFQK